MILAWLDGRKAAELGVALANEFAAQGNGASGTMGPIAVQRADNEVRPLQLNFYKKAKKLANSFTAMALYRERWSCKRNRR